MSLSVNMPLTNVHDHPVFPWLWPGPRAGLSFDLTPDQHQQPVHVPFNITPFTRRGPGLVPDQVGRVGRHAAAMPARRAGPVHCMRAKVTHWFGLLPSSGTIFEGCLLVGSCFNILSTGQHSATWTSPLYARKRATPPNVATAAPAKSTNYTSWKFVVPRKFCFVGLVCFTIIHFASSRVHCMRAIFFFFIGTNNIKVKRKLCKCVKYTNNSCCVSDTIESIVSCSSYLVLQA